MSVFENDPSYERVRKKALIKWSGQLIKVRCVSFAGKICFQVKSGFPYE